jgi:VWFA-related protein
MGWRRSPLARGQQPARSIDTALSTQPSAGAGPASPRRRDARRWVVVATALLAAAPGSEGLDQVGQQPQQPLVREYVDVTRVVVDARVLDGGGRPIRGLRPADFRVTIDGRPARVESATWVEGGAVDEAGLPVAAAKPPATTAQGPTGRLVLFLFQKDFEPSRMVGLMRMLAETRGHLARFTRADRVAVGSFDTHLKIWVDFTNRLEEVHRALHRRVLLERSRPPEPSGWPSLFPRLRLDLARSTYTMEAALRLLADAMAPLPGAKALVIVGHGFGRFDGRTLTFDRSYGPAIRALQSGRVTVFTLDTTQADRHTLDAGLIHVAEETGGFFERTHLFSRRGLERLEGALAGHYVLLVEKPSAGAGTHRIDVRLARRRATVLARRAFTG